jgi:peptidoglycan/xylan/chitin deacetylase (PgdA/CDA1 family)
MNSIVFRILRYSGIAWFFREFVQRKKVTLLLFHDLDKQDAERNFSWLKSHYNLIGLNDYLDAVVNGGPLPDKAVVITFDDGHAGNFDLLPLIEKMQIPITIFLCSGIVGTNRHYWFKHSDEVTPRLQQLKQLPEKDRQEQLRSMGFDKLQQYSDRQALSKDQILKMAPWVDFQSHTRFHPILPLCDDLTAKDEIVNSKIQLEKEYGFSIRSLSYPNGDYSSRDIEFAKQAGYECGVTVDAGYNDKNTDLFRIKRVSVNDAKTLDELIVKASGCFILLKRVLCA